MEDYMDLCMGCMNEKDPGTVCPICGYSDDDPFLPCYLKPGTKLNERYIVGKMLRYNGESVVYIAYDTVKDEKVCIREFMPDTLCSRSKTNDDILVNKNDVVNYKTLLSEFIELNKSLSKLRTLNQITSVYELFSQNNTAYVVFEYFDGITLNEYLQHNAGELDWDEVKEIFPQIFTTLSLVHNAGIIHRGISPQTIFINKNGDCKITDFCITAVRNSNEMLAPELFPGYAAPEQYSSSNWHGPWTDVYAIAAVLYRCLTGCRPTESIARTANDNLQEPARINPNIPHNVSKAIMKGMRISTNARSQTITDFLTDLFEQPAYLSEEESYIEEDDYEPERTLTPKSDGDGEDEIDPEKKTLMLALKIGLITLAVLSVIAVIIIWIFIPDHSSNGTRKNTTTTTSSTTQSSQTSATTSSSDVSSESRIYNVPNFVDVEFARIPVDSYKDVLITIESAYDYNDSVPNGVVYDQSVKAGEKYSEPITIVLKISKGPKTVKLPDYKGKYAEEYFSELSNRGIKYESATDDTNSEYASGKIIAVVDEDGQVISANDEIDNSIGQTVTVIISTYTPPEEPEESNSSSASSQQENPE